MVHVKRVFRAKPGQTRKVSTLAYRAADAYHQVGMRGEFSGYFGPGTTLGEKNIVVLQWTDDTLKSVVRDDNDSPSKSLGMWKELMEHTEENWIEFNELLTPDKMID